MQSWIFFPPRWGRSCPAHRGPTTGIPGCPGWISIPRSALLAAILITGFLTSCEPKIVRVPVTPENRQRASELTREGDIAFARREYYPALIKYTEAVKLDTTNEIILNKMGISYSALGYYGEAETVLRRALEINGKFVYAHNNLGTVYFAQGDHARAQRLFRKAIGLEPKIASFHVNLGQAYMEGGDIKRGMEEIRKGLALDSNVLDKDSSVLLSTPRGKPNAERSYNMARVYATTLDVEKAIKYLREAIDAGFAHLDWVDSEQDFDAIRSNERFALFMSEARLKYRVVPATPPPPDSGVESQLQISRNECHPRQTSPTAVASTYPARPTATGS